MVELDGDIDGTLSMKGDPAKPLLNGELALDSVTFFMPEMSAMFRFDNEPVQVVNSKMMFKEFDIFTKGKTPFTINGEVDFSDLERTAVNLKMHAENYELLNAPVPSGLWFTARCMWILTQRCAVLWRNW